MGLSVVKFGEVIPARRSWQQVKQALRRGICYNLHRAVHLGLSLRLLLHQMLYALKERFSTEQEVVSLGEA